MPGAFRVRVICTISLMIVCGVATYLAVTAHQETLLDDVDRLLILGESPELVESRVRGLLRWQPQNQRALLMLGVSLNRQQRFREAIDVLVLVDPALLPESQVALSSALVSEGRFRKAEQTLRAYLQKFPGDYDLRRMLFELLVQTLRTPEAVQIMEEGLQHASPPDIRLAQLQSILKLITSPMSARAVEDELQRNGNRYQEPEVLVALGQTAAQLGRIRDAEACFQQALTLDSVSPYILVRSAAFFLNQGNPERARQLLNECRIDRDSSSDISDWVAAEYWHLKAVLHLEHAEEYSLALACINRSLEARERAQSLSVKAGLLRRTGQSAAASQIGQRLAEIGHHDFELLKLLGNVKDGRISPQLCEQLETSLRGAGYPQQADAWHKLAEEVLPAVADQ